MDEPQGLILPVNSNVNHEGGLTLSQVKRIANVPLTSPAHQLFKDQGIRVLPVADDHYCHPHTFLHTARKYIESRIYNHIASSESIFEISASSRTIKHNYMHAHYNRPILNDFSGDMNKYNQLRALRGDLNNCNCVFNQCEHKHNKNVLFSVDVIYYIWFDLIAHIMLNPGQRQLHVMHMPKKKGFSKFLNDEGSIEFDGEVLTMESRGNDHVYKHPMYFNADCPSIIIEEGLYLTATPIETVDTGATIYGLYSLSITERKGTPVGRRYITRFIQPTIEEPLKPVLDIHDAINIDVGEGIPQAPGIYKITEGTKTIYVKVHSGVKGEMLIEGSKKWTSLRVDNLNCIIRAVLQATLQHKDESSLTDKIQRVLVTHSTTHSINVDLLPELMDVVMNTSLRISRTIKQATNEHNIRLLLGERNYMIEYFMLLIWIIFDLTLLTQYHYSFTLAVLFGIYRILCKTPIMITIGITAFIRISYSYRLLFLSYFSESLKINYRKNKISFLKFLILILVLFVGIANAEDDYYNSNLADKIVQNCRADQFPVISRESHWAASDYLKEIRTIRSKFHPDRYKGQINNQNVINNCLDNYTSCIKDQICFVNVFVKTESNDLLYKNTIIIVGIILDSTVFWLLFQTIILLCKILNKIRKSKAMLLFIITLTYFAIAYQPTYYPKTQNANLQEYISSKCVSTLINKIPLSQDVVWNVKDINGQQYAYDTERDCNCHLSAIKKKQMVKTNYLIPDSDVPVLYHACWKNNISALNRNAWAMPKPDDVYLHKFRKWFDNVLLTEIKPMLTDFQVHPNAWFNHLTAAKQAEVKHFYVDTEDQLKQTIGIDDIKEMTTYSNFVKSEKQTGLSAKTRCICSPGGKYKYLAGPVTYELEQYFKKNFKGYNVPLTWGEQEEKLDEFEALGYTQTIQLDGKGFDLTQDWEIKKIVDYQIYELISNNLHVDKEIFLQTITPEWRTIIPYTIEDGKRKTYGNIKVRGKTFSGSCDTTLMNTIRMSLYIRFALEHADNIDYKLWVKGDDTVIFARPSDVDQILTSISKVFVTEEQWKQNPNIRHGLGQISKFVKTGSLIDFDFCSTMVIKTEKGYKIIRKLSNIINKEHLSIKIAQINPDAYHNDLLISAQSWLGENETVLAKYYEKIHPYTPGIKPVNKTGKQKEHLPSDVDYQNQYIHFDYQLQKERISCRSFTDDDLVSSLLEMKDTTELESYQLLEKNLGILN